MKNTGMNALVPVLSLALFGTLGVTQAMANCPETALGETPADCPYADVVRTIDGLSKVDHTSIDSVFSQRVPELRSRIRQEAKVAREALPLWGTSLNFDEGAKAKIIRDEVIDYLLGTFGVARREGKIVHAGVEHTYGYLFSNLQTPFGYKRARWVQDDLDRGFLLKPGTLGPNAADGGFLSNVTFFAGSIAFRGEPAALRTIDRLSAVSPQLKHYPFSKLKVRRLEETIRRGDRFVVLRTDIVDFPGKKGANAAALIYSILDSRDDRPVGGRGSAEKEKHPQLISMFPVAGDFADRVFDPKGLGEDQPIITRYNAFVSGVTDSSTRLTGSRRAVRK